MIAHAWSIELYQDKPAASENHASAFVDLCSTMASAWVQFDANGIHASAGEDAAMQGLTELAGEAFTGLDTQLNLTFSDTGRCVVLGTDFETAQSILYVKSGTESALMLVPPKKLATIHQHWCDAID